jgi:hypothetical protein
MGSRWDMFVPGEFAACLVMVMVALNTIHPPLACCTRFNGDPGRWDWTLDAAVSVHPAQRSTGVDKLGERRLVTGL